MNQSHSYFSPMTSLLLEELPLQLLLVGIGLLHFSALLDKLSIFSCYSKTAFFLLTISALASESDFPTLLYSVFRFITMLLL